jgi:DNA-binding transcriptional MerR regulator
LVGVKSEARTPTNQGWLTLHEALEISGLPYARLMHLAEEGLLPTRRAGGTQLYDPSAVEDLAAGQPA